MQQTLQGVSFPDAAAAKAELLQHNRDTADQDRWKTKRSARPRTRDGVGDGKEKEKEKEKEKDKKVRSQDQIMKRKRDGGSASTASLTSVAVSSAVAASESTQKSIEKFELGFLRHDGHFSPAKDRKKGPTRTFVKQYFREKWSEHIKDPAQVGKTKRLNYSAATEAVQAGSNATTSGGLNLIDKTMRYLQAIGRDEIPPTSEGKRSENATTSGGLDLIDKTMRLIQAAIGRDEALSTSESKISENATTTGGLDLIGKTMSLIQAIGRDETPPIKESMRSEDPAAREKAQTTSLLNGEDAKTAMKQTMVASVYNLESSPTNDETQRVSDGAFPRTTEKDEKGNSSGYAQIEEVGPAVGNNSETESKVKWGLPCGTDCNQVRTEIFRKTNTLMKRKPEILHIKPRPNPAPTNVEDDISRVIAIEHQAVQTYFTENKKVQTSSHESKQVQWAIFPKDSLSPTMPKLVTELHKPPGKMQYFRDDTVLMKVSIEPTIQPPHEMYTKEEMYYGHGGIESSGRRMHCPDDSPYVHPGKRTRSPHHLLLYQEALEIAKEQRDLERAREQRHDFWSVYERELKRGRGWLAEGTKPGRRGRWAAEEESSHLGGEEFARAKSPFDAFVDEHLTLGSTSPVSSMAREGSGSGQEAAAIFKQLLDKVESYEISPKEDDLVGLQGLRKTQPGDTLRSLEAMEQQLNPETSLATGQLSPTELDCMKAAILSHSFYPRLVTSFINQHKAGAPPDQVERLEKIRTQVMESWRPAGSPAAHDEKIKKYQDILTKFERELEKPFQDAMDFSWHMEHYLDAIPPSRGRSEMGSSGPENLKDFDGEHYGHRGYN